MGNELREMNELAFNQEAHDYFNSRPYRTISSVHRSAEVSDCGMYRWWLRRSWRFFENGIHVTGKGCCCFILLNPSTADGTQDDPTIRRCIGFAQLWGYDSLSVRNLFAWRATDPKELVHAETVTGGHRGDTELIAGLTANLTVVAWGSKVPFKRDREAVELFNKSFPGVPLHCLGVTKSGSPRHPLYVRADTKPKLWPGMK